MNEKNASKKVVLVVMKEIIFYLKGFHDFVDIFFVILFFNKGQALAKF